MSVVIYKRAYYTDENKQIGPVEVYDQDHKFVGIGEGHKLTLGYKENGYFVEEGGDYEIRVPLGDRMLFEQGKDGTAADVGYNEKGEQKSSNLYIIWKQDLEETYGLFPISEQPKIKKVWSRICRCHE